MKNTTHRVVILKNVNSSIISQAILILKDERYATEKSVMEEAERIVESFMRECQVKQEKKKRKIPSWIMPAAAGTAIVILFGIFKII